MTARDAGAPLGPVGYCIYCGARDCALTDEHTIPDGLGGKTKLLKSSCEKCQKIINDEIENYCQKTLFKNPRLHFGIRSEKSKRKKVPPDPATVRIIDGAGDERIIYPNLDKYPLMLTLPMFPPPIAMRRDFQSNREESGAKWVYGSNRIQRYVTENQLTAVKSPLVDPLRVLRLVAKIAHSHAIGLYPGMFTPLLRAIILGNTAKCFRYVGGDMREWPPESCGQRLSYFQARRAADGQMFLGAEVRFFCNMGAPIYYALVGRISRQSPPDLDLPVREGVLRLPGTIPEFL